MGTSFSKRRSKISGVIILFLYSVCSNSATVIIDKKQSTLSVQESDVNLTVPILLGANLGDGFDNKQTPKGEFSLKKAFSSRLNEEILMFFETESMVLAIHPIWMGNPSQRRVKRLLSPNPNDNRITNGCINVDPDFFYKHLYNLPDNTKLIIKSDY